MGRAKKFFKKVGGFITDQFVVTKHGNAGDNSISGNNLAKNKLYGHGGDDTLKAFGARNELYGGTGDDYLRAIGISNKMRGESGNDKIIGLGAHNDMRGGTGNDSLDGIGAYNDMKGEDGNDVMKGIGAYNKMNGGSGDDRMLGLGAYNDMKSGTGDDRIEAIGGVNKAYGEDGDDVMLGIGGVNLLDGGAGDDIITALGGVNTVKARDGDDKITAIGGVNVLDGGSGDDQIVAAGGVNTIFAGSGADDIVAIGGVNVVDAGSENDLVVAVGGINAIAGGEGNDVLISVGGLNIVNGDQGEDLMIAAGAASVMNGGEGDDIMVGISALNAQNGEGGDDIMVAVGAANVQTGGAGDDMMFSLAKEFTIQHGGSGDDLMAAMGNLNVQIGDDGSDIAFAMGTANVQAGGADKDLMVGVGNFNIQHGGSDDDVLLSKGSLNLQVGAAGGDAMITHGNGNIQFAGRLAADLPTEVNLMGAEVALPTGAVMGLAQEHLNMDDAQDTESNLMIGMGGGNLQIGAAGDDVGIGLGMANMQILGAGDDIGIAGGIGNIQLGQDGSDIMLAAQSPMPGMSVSGTYQSGGDDDDFMITAINDVTDGTPVGMQFGDDGDDTLAMVSLDHRYSDMSNYKDLFEAENVKGAAKATANYAKGVYIDGSTFQFGGDGDDMLISAVSDFAVRSGGDGDDVFLNVVEGGFAAGGDGNDIMVSGFVPSSLYTGGYGADAMFDMASYVRIAFDSVLLEGAADLLTLALEQLLGELDQTVGDLNAGGGNQINALAEGLFALDFQQTLFDVVHEFLTTFDLPAGNNFLGGDGDDTFGIASTSTNAIGGLGDDTFIVHLDAVEGAAVSDAGGGLGNMAEAARKVLDLIDEQEDSKTTATDEVGGHDVVVLRDNDGVSLEDVTVTLIETTDEETGEVLKHLEVLVADTASAAEGLVGLDHVNDVVGLGNSSNVILTSIDDTDSRVESIRLHQDKASELTQIDLAAAFDAGVFDLGVPVAATDLAAYTSEVSGDPGHVLDKRVEETFKDAKDAFKALGDAAKKIADSAVSAVETVAEIILPDDPTGPEYTEEQQEHIDQYSEGGAGADTIDAVGGDLGQFGETRTGDVEGFTVNSIDVAKVETTQTLAMSDGSVLVLFAVKTHSGKTEIHGQRLDSSGNKAGDEFTLETDAVDAHQWEAIALENNEFALRTNNYKGAEHKFIAMPDGGVIKLPDPDNGTYFQHYVKTVTLAGGGEARIDNIRHSEKEGAAAVKIKTADGGNITATSKFAGSNHMRQGDIVALADGGLAVAFQHDYGDKDIWMQIFNEDGSARTGTFNPVVNQEAHSNHKEPQLAALADGSFVLVYNKDEESSEIHMVHLSAEGEQIGDAYIIDGGLGHPSVAALDDGRVVITYVMPDGELVTLFKLMELNFQGGAENNLFEGGNGDDIARGGDGDDALFGGLGDDLIEGEAGNDFLDGGIGDDTVDAGAGHDQLSGGVGDDLLTGGIGDDTFVFMEEIGSSFGNDTITDFTQGEDLIDLLDITRVDSFDDLLIEQDGADTVVKVLNAQGAVATERVFLLDGAEITEEEAQAAADASDAAQADGTATEDGPVLEVIDREVNTIRLEDVDASTLTKDDFAHIGNTVGEFGELELDHVSQNVSLLKDYDNPVVIAFVKTQNGTEIVEARVSNLTKDSFDIALQESVETDGIHAVETVSYMVVEAGRHELSNGMVIEAGTVDVAGLYQQGQEDPMTDVAFQGELSGAETHVFATVNTEGGGSFATARVDDVDADGFKLSIAKSDNLDFELVENGNFSNGGTGWTRSNPTGGDSVLFKNGSAQFNAGNETTFGDSIEQQINTSEGATYAVSLDLWEPYNKGSHEFRIDILDEFGATVASHTATVSPNSIEAVSFEFTATSNGSTIKITNTGASTSASTDGLVDNVSVKEVILAPNLVQNGDFSAGLTNWSVSNPTGGTTVQDRDGAARFNGGNETTFGDSIQQDIRTEEGVTYEMSLDLKEIWNKGNHDFKIEILDENGVPIQTATATVNANTVNTVAFEFTAVSDMSTIKITNTGATTSIGTDGLVDNVTVVEKVTISSESVGYIAFQDGAFDGMQTGLINLEEKALATEVAFDFAQITEVNGRDTGVVRQNLEQDFVFIQEDLSLDSETDHGLDEVSFLHLTQDEGLLLI